MEKKNKFDRNLIAIPTLYDIEPLEGETEGKIKTSIDNIKIEIIRDVVDRVYRCGTFICHIKLEKFEIQMILNKLANILQVKSLVVYTGKSVSTFLEKSEILKHDTSTVIRLPNDYNKKLIKLKSKENMDIAQLDALYYKVSNYAICVIDQRDLKFLSNFTAIKFEVCLFLGKNFENEKEVPLYELAEIGKYCKKIIYAC